MNAPLIIQVCFLSLSLPFPGFKDTHTFLCPRLILYCTFLVSVDIASGESLCLSIHASPHHHHPRVICGNQA